MSANRTAKSALQAEQGVSRVMSCVAEASSRMKSIAEPYPAGDKIKAAIERARRLVSAELRACGFDVMSYGRAKRIWKQEARRIDGEEIDAIRRADKQERVTLGEARAEYAKLLDRIAACETILGLQDADFHSVSRDALRGVAGSPDRAMASAPLIPRSDGGGGEHG